MTANLCKNSTQSTNYTRGNRREDRNDRGRSRERRSSSPQQERSRRSVNPQSGNSGRRGRGRNNSSPSTSRERLSSPTLNQRGRRTSPPTSPPTLDGLFSMVNGMRQNQVVNQNDIDSRLSNLERGLGPPSTRGHGTAPRGRRAGQARRSRVLAPPTQATCDELRMGLYDDNAEDISGSSRSLTDAGKAARKELKVKSEIFRLLRNLLLELTFNVSNSLS